MICKNCNETIPDDSTFCQFCGYKSEPVAPAPAAAEEEYSYFQPEVTEDTQPPKPKKKVGLIIALVIVALSMFCVLVAGLLTNWFGLNGPAMQIALGTRKTLLKSGSFVVDFDAKYDGESIKGTASVAINPKKKELTVFAETKYDGENAVIAIYDGYLIVEYDGEYMCENISDELDEFFEYYENVQENISLKPDWEEIIDNDYLYEAAEEVVDFDELNSTLPKYLRKLNSTAWLKKNAGYSVKRESGVKMHTFKPDAYKFLKATLPIFKDVFVEKDTYEELEDGLDYIEEYADEMDIQFAIGVKGGKLVRITADIDADGEQIEGELKFSKIGKVKFDTKKLEDMLEDAQSYSYGY